MRLDPAQVLIKREVSYEFMNRQMVWHAFTVRPVFICAHCRLIPYE
jgi:peroxin-2